MSHHDLDPALNWTCGFSPDDVLECLDVATWHGFRLTDDGLSIDCMMASCDTHRSRMQADYEHPMDTPCCVTGSRFVWPENFCYLEWGDELALTGQARADASLAPALGAYRRDGGQSIAARQEEAS